jgi:hypothetical protein
VKPKTASKKIATIQIVLGVIILLVSIIGTHYFTTDHYFNLDNEYDNDGDPKGVFNLIVSDFIEEYHDYSSSKKSTYVQSLGYSDEEYNNLDKELFEELEKDYMNLNGDRQEIEVIGTVLMFNLIGKSFLYVFIFLGFISSILSLILITSGMFNYYK